MTDFPPPPGYDLYEARDYGEYGYERECTAEEADLLDANDAAADAEERAEDEQVRDSWFALLRGDLDDAAGDAGQPGPADPEPCRDG